MKRQTLRAGDSECSMDKTCSSRKRRGGGGSGQTKTCSSQKQRERIKIMANRKRRENKQKRPVNLSQNGQNPRVHTTPRRLIFPSQSADEHRCWYRKDASRLEAVWQKRTLNTNPGGSERSHGKRLPAAQPWQSIRVIAIAGHVCHSFQPHRAVLHHQNKQHAQTERYTIEKAVNNSRLCLERRAWFTSCRHGTSCVLDDTPPCHSRTKASHMMTHFLRESWEFCRIKKKKKLNQQINQ